MIEFLSQPWPWYVGGPMIGLTVALLLLFGGKAFGVSSSLEHACAATLPGRSSLLRYDWRAKGLWNLVFVAGIALGGLIAGLWLANPEPMALAEATRADLAELGLGEAAGLVPPEIYSLRALATPAGFVVLVVGGFLVGFGARYANGCTSGHGVTGLAMLRHSALVALAGFFAGGLIATHLLLPLIL